MLKRRGARGGGGGRRRDELNRNGETEERGGFKRNHRKARVITLLTFIGLSPISCAEVLFYLFIFLILF